jgi:alpha-L-fucosidase
MTAAEAPRPAETTRMAPPSAGLPSYPAVVRRESAAQTEARLTWFREARFGLLIHWGVYSAPAGSWRGQRAGAEYIMQQARIPIADYRRLSREFTAAKFDPQAWAQLAEDAGMRYVVLTAKHRDGFALFDSAASDWNSAKESGAHRDLVQPLADAVRGHGLRFGVCYSQSQDWVNGGGGRGAASAWDLDQQQGSFDEYLETLALPQVKELLDRIHPDLIAWDSEYGMTPERARPFFDLVQKYPNVLQNSRLGGGVLGDFRTSDRVPTVGLPGGVIEVSQSINNSWGYRADDLNWKPAQQLIRTLSEVASRDANFLLNVGPTADGEIPEAEIDRLRAIGRWMKVYGDAIYGTRGGIYPEPLSWGRTTWKRHASGAVTLYLHVWNWPSDGKLLVPDIMQAPRSARLLANASAIPTELTPAGVLLRLQTGATDAAVSVIALEFSKAFTLKNGLSRPADSGGSGSLLNPAGR